ncbi:MAG: hypothetical protein ACO3HN_06360 [Opitutales bacterium]
MATAIGSYATASLLKTQAGIGDDTDDTVLGYVCDRINQYIESKTHRVLAPISSTTYLYDGDGSRSLYLPFPVDKAPIGGIRAVSLVEAKSYTGDSFATVNSADYFLRQQVGMTGPYERLVFTDYPAGTFSYWPAGYGTIRVTATAGWAAIPDDIAEVALTAATRAWHSIQSGQTDTVGTNEMGLPVVSRFFSARDLETLARYSADIP